MSGPKTTSYRLSDAIEDLSRAVQQLEESARQQAAEARRLEEEGRRRAEAERQRREAAARARAEEARRRESIRLERLSAARATRRRLALMHEEFLNAMAVLPGEDKPSLPSIPDIEDESTVALEELLRSFAGIEQRLTEVRARVATASALVNMDFPWLGEAESLAQLLDRFAKVRHGHGAQSEAIDQATARAANVGRIVGHLLDVSVNELPPSFESLVQRALSVESAARFDMLRIELQRQVQLHNERVKARRRGSESAAGWIDRLRAIDTEGHFADLREALTQVRDGVRPWDQAFESECSAAFQTLERSAEQRRDTRAAAILEATLHDLGYEVDGIAQTLFAEGGALHFQGRGWNDYFMRLQVLPDRKTLHFNMVRAADAPTSAARDLEMEQQWCRGYPELMKTLAARGIETEPLRAVAAGSFAVQAVLPDSLPKRQKSTTQQSAPAAASQLPRQ